MREQPEGPLEAGVLRRGSAAARWTIAATVGGSAMTMLDATVVNVALPAIDRELDAQVSVDAPTTRAFPPVAVPARTPAISG